MIEIGSKSIISRIAHNATRVCGWFSQNKAISARVAILVPYGDKIKDELQHKYTVIEGPEQNVFLRYQKAMGLYSPDYMVRITGDCVWLPSRVISKHIRDAVKYDADYTSNVIIRTFMEGYDCEVLSSNLFIWLMQQNLKPHHLEHVTSYVYEKLQENELPKDFKIHTVLNEFDSSEIKTSIDTPQEYEQACVLWDAIKKKKNDALDFGTVSN
jgi:spore coat polysaccharide biosynthesis protein SpsF (cytidylyltransferase family)